MFSLINMEFLKIYTVMEFYINLHITIIEKHSFSIVSYEYQAGVAKMNEAREVVSRLKAEAAKKETVLAEKQEEANRALQLITDTMKNANDQKVQMETLKEQTLNENKKIAERLVPAYGSLHLDSAMSLIVTRFKSRLLLFLHFGSDPGYCPCMPKVTNRYFLSFFHTAVNFKASHNTFFHLYKITHSNK